jgi:hypothetical protein
MNDTTNAGAPATQPKPGTARYRALLAVDIEGKVYQYGQPVELDAATAKAYSHALVSEDAAAGAAAMQSAEEAKTQAFEGSK